MKWNVQMHDYSVHFVVDGLREIPKKGKLLIFTI